MGDEKKLETKIKRAAKNREYYQNETKEEREVRLAKRREYERKYLQNPEARAKKRLRDKRYNEKLKARRAKLKEEKENAKA